MGKARNLVRKGLGKCSRASPRRYLAVGGRTRQVCQTRPVEGVQRQIFPPSFGFGIRV